MSYFVATLKPSGLYSNPSDIPQNGLNLMAPKIKTLAIKTLRLSMAGYLVASSLCLYENGFNSSKLIDFTKLAVGCYACCFVIFNGMRILLLRDAITSCYRADISSITDKNVSLRILNRQLDQAKADLERQSTGWKGWVSRGIERILCGSTFIQKIDDLKSKIPLQETKVA